MERRSTSTAVTGSSTSTTVRDYEDTSDNPAWATTTTGDDTETSRYVSSIAGDLSITKDMSSGFLSLGVLDPQGSVVATSYVKTISADSEAGTSEQSVTAWSGLELFDEYGNKLSNVLEKAAGALEYLWFGGKERAIDTSGLVLMSVRLHNSVTGHFTSVDPVKGGNTTRYSYPQDPINQFDLDGNAGWWIRNWKKAAVGVVVAAAVVATCGFATGFCGVAAHGAVRIATAGVSARGVRIVGNTARKRF